MSWRDLVCVGSNRRAKDGAVKSAMTATSLLQWPRSRCSLPLLMTSFLQKTRVFDRRGACVVFQTFQPVIPPIGDESIAKVFNSSLIPLLVITCLTDGCPQASRENGGESDGKRESSPRFHRPHCAHIRSNGGKCTCWLRQRCSACTGSAANEKPAEEKRARRAIYI